MAESTTNPRRRTYEFRQLVALVLQVLDVPAQPRPEAPQTLHERLQEPRDPSDITGIAGWLIRTHTATNRDLSGALDQAQQAAEEAGTPHFATVWRRHRRMAQDAYVVLTLTQFGMLVAESKKNLGDEEE